MNNIFKNIIDKNEVFINYVHILFMHFYKIESNKGLDKIECRIISSIFEEFQNRDFVKYIDNFHIEFLENLKYKIYLYDTLFQHWYFQIDIEENSTIKLLCCSRILRCGYFISSSDISELDFCNGNTFVLNNRIISKEDIEIINLKYDIDISVFDLNDVSFKYNEALKFVTEL